jgi:hypothetical protein
VATVCVPAKLGHVFAVGSLGCAQKSFGEVAESPFGPEQSYTNRFGKKRQLRFIMQLYLTVVRNTSLLTVIVSSGTDLHRWVQIWITYLSLVSFPLRFQLVDFIVLNICCFYFA